MKNVTIQDVAKLAKVGVGTVSRVINGGKNVSAKTRANVLDAIDQTGFTPNSSGIRLRKKETRFVALMVPVINHPFFAALASAIESDLDQAGYQMVLVASQQRVAKENEIISRIRRKEVDGAIFVTHFPHEVSEVEKCAIVSIDRNLGDNIPVVTSNNYDATLEALAYLEKKGCRQIAYLGTKPHESSFVSERSKAYLDFVKERGIEPLMVNEDILHGEETPLVDHFLQRFPQADGVFAAGYSIGLALYRRYLALGKRVPEDVQIVVYDGAFDAFSDGKRFSCVQQPIAEMAATAVRLLLAKLKGSPENVKAIVLKTEIFPGETTK